MPFKSNQFDLDEVYRQLRTNIEFSRMDEGIQVVNTISTNPNEGKSTVAANLARVSADKYARVLLIDCDLRNPTIHRLMGVSNSFGLTNLLADFDGSMESVNKAIQSIETDTGKVFYMISSGSRVPNPLEILSSNRFSKFMSLMRQQFDFIVIDCPPIGACSDGVPVSNASDGTLLIVSSKDTDKRAAKTASRDLMRAGANIIGVVLTKVENFTNSHYYYYGYGEDGKRKKKSKTKKMKKVK